MQTCSNCGTSVREGARFCTACGTQLNEANSGSSPFSWGAAIEQATVPEGGWPSAAATSDHSGDADESSTASQTWNWSGEADGLPAEAVDGETGIVLDDPDREPETGLVDPTELGDLDAPIEAEEPGTAADEEPDLAIVEDEVSINTDDETARDDGQETLAAWAQDWASEPDSAGLEASDVATSGVIVAEELQVGTSLQAGPADDTDDEDEEETLAKAERLIAELQSLVPRLARPKPANPFQKLTPQRLADELDERADGSQWADLREVLEKARDNPHDINHLMSVSGNASRLLELMDDREHLASRASSVAQRLRNPEDSPDDV